MEVVVVVLSQVGGRGVDDCAAWLRVRGVDERRVPTQTRHALRVGHPVQQSACPSLGAEPLRSKSIEHCVLFFLSCFSRIL